MPFIFEYTAQFCGAGMFAKPQREATKKSVGANEAADLAAANATNQAANKSGGARARGQPRLAHAR